MQERVDNDRFRWVTCQLDFLSGLITEKQIRAALGQSLVSFGRPCYDVTHSRGYGEMFRK
jgi:hypothetical protein